MSSQHMAPPVGQEHHQEAEAAEDALNHTGRGVVIGKNGFIREDWSEALQRLIAERNGELRNPSRAGEAFSAAGDAMEEAEPIASHIAHVQETAVDATAPSGDAEERPFDAAAPTGEVTEEAVDAAAPSGDRKEQPVDVHEAGREEALDVEEVAVPSGEVKEEDVDASAPSGVVKEEVVDASVPTGDEKGEVVADQEAAAAPVKEEAVDAAEEAAVPSGEVGERLRALDAAAPSGDGKDEAVDVQEAAAPSGEMSEESVDVEEAAAPSGQVKEEFVDDQEAVPSGDVEERALDTGAPSGDVKEEALDDAAPSGDVKEEAMDVMEAATPSGDVNEEYMGLQEAASPSAERSMDDQEAAPSVDVEERALYTGAPSVDMKDEAVDSAAPSGGVESVDVQEAAAPSDELKEEAVGVEEAAAPSAGRSMDDRDAVPSGDVEERALDTGAPSGDVKEEAVDDGAPSGELEEAVDDEEAASSSDDVKEEVVDGGALSSEVEEAVDVQEGAASSSDVKQDDVDVEEAAAPSAGRSMDDQEAAPSGDAEERAPDTGAPSWDVGEAVDDGAPSSEVEESVDVQEVAAPSDELKEEAVDVEEATAPSAGRSMDDQEAAPLGDVEERAPYTGAPSGDVKEEAMDDGAPSGEVEEAVDDEEAAVSSDDVKEEAVDGGAQSGEVEEAVDVEEATAPSAGRSMDGQEAASSGDVEERALDTAVPFGDVKEAMDDGAPSAEVEESVDIQEAAAPSDVVKEEAVDDAVPSGGVEEATAPSAERSMDDQEAALSDDVEERALDTGVPSRDVGTGEEAGENGDREGVAGADGEVELEGAAEDVGEKSVDLNSEEPANEVVAKESSAEEVDSAPAVPAEVVEEKSTGVSPGEPATDVVAKELLAEADCAPVVAAEVVKEKCLKVNTEEPAAAVCSEGPVEEAAIGEVVANADATDESSQAEALAHPKDNVVEEKAVEVNPVEGVEVAEKDSAEAPAEESLDSVERFDAPVGAIADIANAELEEPGSELEANPKCSEDKPAEGMVASVQSVGAESTEKAEPSEIVDAPVEEVATSGDVEEKAVEVEDWDLNEGEAIPETPGEAPDASVEEAVAPSDAEPVMESVPVSSDVMGERAVEVNSDEASPVAMPEEAVSEARGAHVEEVVEDPMTGASREEASLAEEAPEKVISEAVDAPVAETEDKMEDAAASVEPDVERTSAEVDAPETEEQSATVATSSPLPADDELFDLPTGGTRAETSSSQDRNFQVVELPQESEPESQTQSIPTEAEVKDAEVAEIPGEQSVIEKEGVPEPAITEKILSIPIEHTSEEPSNALAESCDKDPLMNEPEHPTDTVACIIGSVTKELPSTNDDVASGIVKSVDVSNLLQTVMTDEEVKEAAAVYSLEEEAGTQVLEAETVHGEPEVPAASQAKEFETVTREFNLNDVSEVPVTSEVEWGSGDSHVVAPYLAPALAAAGCETVEAASKSSSLDEVATHLHDAAAKTLQDAEASEGGKNQSSVVKTVAQIVLEESSNANDSSEYISEVVQHVAQFAQDAGQSDPNVLPDTVARVFDGETTASSANEVTQSKGTTSLGTMVSLFVIWCVSLCASRVSSQDMPAPALKLAAEEVTAVLQTNTSSQSTSAQGTVTSSH